MKWLHKLSILFCVGGLIYCVLEMLWRNRTHFSMFIVGGICFVIIGLLNEFFTYDMSLIVQMIIGGLIITFIELIAGIILNLILKLNIWNYSNLPFNLWGQICLYFTVLWMLLSLPAIILDDYLRYLLFEEEKPHYKLF